MTMHTSRALVGAVLVAAAMTSEAGGPPEQYRGTVIATSGARSGQKIEIVLHADTFINEVRLLQLAEVLTAEGEDALLRLVRQLPAAGWIEIGGSFRTELRAVRSVGSGPVRQLRFLTTPAIQYDDLTMMTRSPDYNYGFVELVVDEHGEGEGTIIPAAAIELSNGKIGVAGLGSYAFRILHVRPDPAGDQAQPIGAAAPSDAGGR